MKNKILTIFLIMFFIVITFCTNSVFGVEGVSQGWIIDENGQRALVFRTFTAPHSSLEKRYYDALQAKKGDGDVGGGATWEYGGKNITSEWIEDDDTGMITPATTTFGTMGFAFHTQKICKYDSETKNNGVNIGYNLATAPLTYNVATIKTAVDNSSSQYATPVRVKNYNNSLLYEIMNTTGKESTVTWGTKLKVTGLTAYGSTEYRYAIVDIGDLGNVVVVDNIIREPDLTNLLKEMVERKDELTDKTDNNLVCWVSNIVISATKHSSGGYEVSRTADKFFTQYDKNGYSGWWWGAHTRGHDGTKSMGSVINLYDNKLIFPSMSKRNVYVRHINIGMNTTISQSIVENGTRIRPSVAELKIDGSTITGTRGTTTSSYQETFEDKINIDQKIEESALPNTSTYKCIGYNVSVSSSKSNAQSSINTKIRNGKYVKGKNKVEIAAKDASAEDDYIVIDFYYTEYEKDVTVNHLYVDKNGYVKEISEQKIIPNETATMDDITINRKNPDRFIKEVYAKKLGSNIAVSRANSLTYSDTLEYIGYERFSDTKSASSFVGKQISEDELSKKTTATLTSEYVQVNFYYEYKPEKELNEPPKEIEGKVFISATGDKIVEAECNDTEEKLFNITSIPSGSKAKVGIKEIPRFMVGAITTEYVSPATQQHNIDMTAQFKMGNETQSVKYTQLPYKAGYYKITDMAVYELTNAEVFDAGSDGTIGESLFNWNNGKLKVNPKDMDLKVELTGINNKTIANTSKAINAVSNYVAVSIKDKYGNESSSSNSTVTTVYLTLEQLNAVDMNSDGAVNNKDKTYAQNKLKDYEDTLQAKKDEQERLQGIYDRTIEEENDLKSKLDTAEKKLEELNKEYQDALAEKSERNQAQFNANNDLIALQNELRTKKGELESLEITLTNQEKAKLDAEKDYNEKVNEKERLNNVYQQRINDRNTLATNAECNDSVDEDIYVNLEQAEKDALEQCRLAKEEYQKNLDDKVVEKAQKAYEDYLVVVDKAKDNKDKAIEAYNKTLNTDIPNKNGEISTLNSNISTQQGLVNTLEKAYTDFVNGEYKEAKEAYETYRDGAYKIAVDNLNEFNEINYKNNELTALKDLNNAKDETKKAQEDYDNYSNKVDILNEKYDAYKEKYDEFVALKETINQAGNQAAKLVAKKLDLKLTIHVQNMTVKVNEQLLATSDKNTALYTCDLYDYLNSDDVPQITTEKLKISKDVYSNIGSTQIKESDYSNINNIASSKLNGVRTLAGKAVYDAKVVIGENTVTEIKDTVYYADKNTNKDEEITYIFKLKTLRLTKEYKIDASIDINNSNGTINEEAVNERYRYVEPVNVYTPITVSSNLTTDDSLIVDQTNVENEGSSVIQINVPFRIDFDNNVHEGIYNINNTTKYSKGYYIKFDFDVNNVKINGRRYKNGAKVPAGTWIGLIPKRDEGNSYIVAQAYLADNANVVTEDNNKYTVRAVAYNIPSILQNRVLRFKTLDELNAQIGSIIATAEKNDPQGLLDYVNICKHPTYVAEEQKSVLLLNRVYDFRVTDVKDISWKSVFRKTGGNSTNAHKEVAYYSGVSRWNTESEKSNSIVRRISSEIGKNPLRILPVGPYKNADSTYIKAPKIGYRFSFDMKVTGAYYSMQKGANGKVTTQVREDKKVQIATKFYYLSKDGTKYLKESDGSSKGIYLFYKTSDGKYLRIDNNGGRYDIRFTPNDGYRYIEDSDISTLATQSLNIGNLRHLTLTSQMATVTDNQAAITYYGEYKLPNSTIAVEVNADGSYDINKPLKDGYIGVVFDISATTGEYKAGTPVKLTYSKDTSKDKPNTSQWDYEGFLGYTSYGKRVSDSKPITLKLEKGKWTINNDLYQEIKGTVMLYDLDQRAATDYE